MKILHIGNTGGVSTTLRNIDRARGNKSTVINTYQHPFKYDIDDFISITGKNIPSVLNCIKLYTKTLFYDRIHYHTTPIVCGLDMLILKYLFRKEIYIHYHGTEIRDKKQPFVHKLVADRTFVATPDLLKDVPHAEWLPNLVIDEDFDFGIREQYLKSRKPTDPFVILHTPTDRFQKGTDYIEDAINRMKEDCYNIEFRLINGKSHKEILKEMAICDLYIDQVTIGWYGVSSLECIRMGVPSVCYIDEELQNKYNTPFIRASKDNIYEVLKSVYEGGLDALQAVRESELDYYLWNHLLAADELYF
jgi:hypothetical protein